jgi:dienelactone hydrolase
MNRPAATLGRIALMALACVVALTPASCGKPSATQLAEGMVDAMAKGDFAAATRDFDATMTAAMSAEQLRQAWSRVTTQAGAFKSRTGTREAREHGYLIEYVTCQFEKATLDVKVVIGEDGKITGLWFAPPTSTAETPYSPPAYVHKDRFDERGITVGSGEWQLPGTLTMPRGDGPFPIVVLVHGSGPHDRNETIGPNKPFKDIAWGLASNGIAVLRYDKRTFDPRTKANLAKIADKLTVKEEVIDDALAAVALARESPGIDPRRVSVLGHSLGGTLIPRIGKADRRIAGLIVMAGCTRPFEDVVLEQLTYVASLSNPLSAEAQAQMAQWKREIAAVKALKPSSKGTTLLLGVPPSYWLDLRGYVPAEMAKSLTQPMLILQGGRDYQVTEADFKIWKDALSSRANVTCKLYPDLNHLFMTGTGKATPAEYEKPGAVAHSVVTDISDWINAQQGSAGAK